MIHDESMPHDESEPNDEPAIRVQGLWHGFGANNLMENLSFDVPKGAVCGLLGPNGCGKTTLIQLLMGVLRPRAGQLWMLGREPEFETVAIRRRVGYVPQVSDLDTTLTVDQTFEFLRPFFEPRWNVQRVEELCRRFGIDSKRSTEVGRLSVGIRQRVSLIAALAIEPELLLLDEPAAGLDAVARREFAEAVVDYTSEVGRTVVLSSHLIGELERLIDHVVILRGVNSPIVCSLDVLKTRMVCLVGRFEVAPTDYPKMPQLVGFRRVRDQVRLVFWDEGGSLDTARAWLVEAGATGIGIDEDSSLETRFIDLVAVA